MLVNDMAEVSIDAELLARGAAAPPGGLVSLSNGCICCTLRADLVQARAPCCQAPACPHWEALPHSGAEVGVGLRVGCLLCVWLQEAHAKPRLQLLACACACGLRHACGAPTWACGGQEVAALAAQGRFDYLVIESTGARPCRAKPCIHAMQAAVHARAVSHSADHE